MPEFLICFPDGGKRRGMVEAGFILEFEDREPLEPAALSEPFEHISIDGGTWYRATGGSQGEIRERLRSVVGDDAMAASVEMI